MSVLGRSITVPQIKLLQIRLKEVGLTDRPDQLAYYTHVAARSVESCKELTRTEAGWVLDDLEAYQREGRGFLAKLRGES